MNREQQVILLLKLITGFSATLTAIMLWSKTRDSAWLFIVLGTVSLYSEVIISALDLLGLSEFHLFTVYGISLIGIIFAVFPFIFFFIGFILFLTGKRRRF
ncbi:MAG: hypothetical protein JEY91_00590 [Spirochaetaceae bacterium]|nr:hypothetical protein [Spirochaetaceae bacterium]